MLSDKRIIIGLGSGRCGTTTLSYILNQYNASVTHEQYQMSWGFDYHDLRQNIKLLEQRQGEVVGDVAFWWLNYVTAIAHRDVKFVCLKRDKQQTVDSFMKWFEKENYWTEDAKETDTYETKGDITVIKRTLNTSYPKFPGIKDKRKAIGIFYDLYYSIAEKFYKQLSNFAIFETDCLNSIEGQKRIFDYFQLPEHEPKLVRLYSSVDNVRGRHTKKYIENKGDIHEHTGNDNN